MFWIEIIIYILLLIAIGIGHEKFEFSSRKTKIKIVICAIAIISLIITYIPIRFTVFTIPRLILFTSIGLTIYLFGEGYFEEIFSIGSLITFLAYLIAIIVYIINIENCEPDIKIKDTPIVAITTDENNRDWYILYELSEYTYCYQDKNKDIKLVSIPANSTKIHYIKDDEKPHLEKKIKTTYSCYKGDRNNTNWDGNEKVTYKLCIPKKSIRYSYYEKAEEQKKDKE